MRMPISRVRSVTDTSMMFMMPMPPTTSDTEAIAPSISDMTRVVWRLHIGERRQVADGEIIVLALAGVRWRSAAARHLALGAAHQLSERLAPG